MIVADRTLALFRSIRKNGEFWNWGYNRTAIVWFYVLEPPHCCFCFDLTDGMTSVSQLCRVLARSRINWACKKRKWSGAFQTAGRHDSSKPKSWARVRKQTFVPERICWQNRRTFFTCSGGSVRHILLELISKPRKDIFWVGVRSYFSLFTTKPRLSRKVIAISVKWRVSCGDDPIKSMSSR